jgi:type I restriction enzyme R subunit
MSNFSFLQGKFEVLFNDSIKAESNMMDDPQVSAIYARKALENSIKLVYKIDEELNENLINELDLVKLINYYEFRYILPKEFIDELHYIRKVGNQAVHTNRVIDSKETVYANKCLYKFQRWIVEVYSDIQIDGEYDILQSVKSQKEDKEELLAQDEDVQKLEEEYKKLQKEFEALKAKLDTTVQPQKEEKRTHIVEVKEINEKETRARLIDLELKEAGYKIENFTKGKDIEYKLTLEDG